MNPTGESIPPGCDELKLKFRQAYKHRPWAVGTTFTYAPFGWILRILGFIVTIAGIAFIISASTELVVFDSIIDKECPKCREIMNISLIKGLIGAILTAFGLLFVLSGRLCRSIVWRNIYILELEEIFKDEES